MPACLVPGCNTVTDAARYCPSCAAPLPGAAFGPAGHRMQAHLGSGYFADVFRTGRLAAKVFRRGPRAADAAVHEIAALSDLGPGLAPALFGSFFDDGRTFVLMELIEGPSLRERIEAQGPLGTPEVRRIFGDVAAGLEAIAARGWVCCDLHPRNIHPWTPTGARLLDFDGARTIGAPAEAGGRIGYRAPERDLGPPLTAACDVFSFAGCIAFALIGTDPRADGPLDLGQLLDRSRVDGLNACRAEDPAGRPSWSDLRAAW